MFLIVFCIAIFVIITEVNSHTWKCILTGVSAASLYLLGTLGFVIVAAIVIGISIKNKI